LRICTITDGFFRLTFFRPDNRRTRANLTTVDAEERAADGSGADNGDQVEDSEEDRVSSSATEDIYGNEDDGAFAGAGAGESKDNLVCRLCGGPGHYACTKEKGEGPFRSAMCSSCMGIEKKDCPPDYLCERHRQGAQIKLQYGGKHCLECGPAVEQATNCCTDCGKHLCLHHFQMTESAMDAIFSKKGASVCRNCFGENDSEFEGLRERAALHLLDQIVGGARDISQCLGWSVETVKAELQKKKSGDTAAWSRVCDIAEEFGVFVYSLITCGLSELAGRLMRIVMVVNLAMNALGVCMLLPQNVFYMLSPDPQKLANGRTLAQVLRYFGRHVLDMETARLRIGGAKVFPAFDNASAFSNKKLRIAFMLFDGAISSPTHDLTQGTLLCFLDDPGYDVYLVVRTTLTRRHSQKSCPYDRSNPSVRRLLHELGTKNIIYIYSDYTDLEVVKKLRKLRLNILIHINGYNQNHFLHVLAMARVAEIVFEWLSLASLLMCVSLTSWTIADKTMVTREQLDAPDREAILWIPFPYPSEDYFRDEMLKLGAPSDPPTDARPGLIFIGGIERLSNEFGLLHAVMDILHRVTTDNRHGKICLYVQETSSSKLLEIIKMARAYCKERGYSDDLSDQIVTYPFYVNKMDLFHFFWSQYGRLLAIAFDPINPHTGCYDASHGCVAVLTWWSEHSQWPGLVAKTMNNMLGTGDVLNTKSREEFTETAVVYLLEKERILALSKHIWSEQVLGRGIFDGYRVARSMLASFPTCLETIRSHSNGRLPDIDSEKFCQVQTSPKFEWPDELGAPRGTIQHLDDNPEMEVNKIVCKMHSVGCFFSNKDKDVPERILRYNQQYMKLDAVAGRGGARVTVIGRWKPPSDATTRSQLDCKEGTILALKLDLREPVPRTAKNMHNSETVREQQIASVILKILKRYKKMRHMSTRPIAAYPERSTLGFLRKGENVHIFSLWEAIPTTDLAKSELVASIRLNFTQEGRVDERTRAFARNILFLSKVFADDLGYAQLDWSTGNCYELTPAQVFPGLTFASELHRPLGFGFLDLGGAVPIGTLKDRMDHRPHKGPAVSLTRNATAAPARRSDQNVGLPRPDGSGFGFINAAKLDEYTRHRKQSSTGLGRTGVTAGYECPGLRRIREKASGDEVLEIEDALRGHSYGAAAMIYNAIFCRRLQTQTMDDYLAEQEQAAESQEAMLEAMKRRVQAGVEIQQPETIELFANLMWNLMRRGEPLSVQQCLVHPVLTCNIYSREQLAEIKGVGLLMPGGPGPTGSPWEHQRFPAWRLVLDGPDGKRDGSWGMGLVAEETLKEGDFAALYAGFEFSLNNEDSSAEWPEGRANVSVNDGNPRRADFKIMGELPLEELQRLCAPGQFFNAKKSGYGANLVMQRRNAWCDGKGRAFLPMVAAKGGIAKGQGGYWAYDHESGAKGANSTSLNDSKFQIRSNLEPRSRGVDGGSGAIGDKEYL